MSWKPGRPTGDYTPSDTPPPRKGNCAVCNGKGTINRIKPGTKDTIETVPCPQACAATR